MCLLYFRAKERVKKQQIAKNIPAAQRNAATQDLHKRIRVRNGIY